MVGNADFPAGSCECTPEGSFVPSLLNGKGVQLFFVLWLAARIQLASCPGRL